MTLSVDDYVLVDSSTGVVLGADTTVIVPEVFGGFGYDILYDPDAAIEYAEQQGVQLDPPGGELELSKLGAEHRSYLAIDIETGASAAPADLRLVPAGGEEHLEELLEMETSSLRELALEEGLVPSVSSVIRDLEGLPFERTVS